MPVSNCQWLFSILVIVNVFFIKMVYFFCICSTAELIPFEDIGLEPMTGAYYFLLKPSFRMMFFQFRVEFVFLLKSFYKLRQSFILDTHFFHQLKYFFAVGIQTTEWYLHYQLAVDCIILLNPF